jgi:3-hexulose-6-phosphate synthase
LNSNNSNPQQHPLLQLALDGTLEQAMRVMEHVAPLVDIVEIGTPLLYREGIRVAAHIHQMFPDVMLVADLKIMDAGDEEASIAFEAGCRYVTVLGVSQDKTIHGVVAAAKRHGGEVMADMMQVNGVVERGHYLLALGCDYLCVHTAFDQQEVETPLATLKRLRKGLPDAALAVAGGVGLPTIDSILAQNPAIVVVGGAITRAADPAAVTKRLREKMAAHPQT